ncbi:MAG: hypothetical protein GW911_35420, partial [Armatimonadetes bacterium]|nr:hypothetical protein [Armatimonadota bacterium]
SALASTVTSAVEPVKRAPSRSKASETEWAFELIASVNDVTDRGTVVGVSSRAPAQIVSPPPTPADRFVDLSLIGNGRAEFERRLAVDIRNEVATRAAWDLLLTTNQSNADVRITWPELSFVPKQYRLRIVDALTGEVQSLRSSSVLRLRTGREALTQRRLRLELYPAAEGGVRVSGLSVAPGRGGRGAGVSFSLSEDAAVTVKLVAANGRPVQTLGPIPLQAGLNNVPWDGRAVSSQAAPRGVYMLEVAARTDSGEVFRAVRSITLR